MVKHLAIIMDGNRRWAKQNGFEAFMGHRKGSETAQKVVDYCLTKNITVLSLYLLSIENLYKRSELEKKYLFSLLLDLIEKNLDEYLKKGVQIKFVGDRALFPKEVVNSCIKAEEATKDQTKLQLNFLFCYGGRQEILDATKRIAQQIKTGELKEDQITDELFSKYLWTGNTPDPDLIIRTGKQQRLSNFMPYKSAYSELYFLDLLWPEVQIEDLETAIKHFENQKRNFGA
jgi:undecaprenyl diphosphate synthase